MHTYGLSSRNYTVNGDAELDGVLRGVTCIFPMCGQVMDGRLRAQGVHVERERMRESMRRVDPSGVHADTNDESTEAKDV